jgi:hypothetical protein
MLRLDTLALTLIGKAGQFTPAGRVALRDCLEAPATDDPEDRGLAELGIVVWEMPEEWRRRLRHCDHPWCQEPYFLARAPGRRDRYCTKAHEQQVRRLRTRVTTWCASIQPGRLAPPDRP